MPGQNSRNNRFTRQLNEIIDQNISNERFGVSELADKMNMSRSNLHRRIKRTTGNSVSQYLRKVRLHNAMELLKDHNLNVSEVAFAVGFGSVNYFSKCFKDYFGYPPVEVDTSVEIPETIADSPGKKKRLVNFPVQNTSFVGREKEIKTITGLVNKHRIVSLVGTGGCGKTRLACQAVLTLDNEYTDGIWFINLAPVISEELVEKELLDGLQIAEIPDKPIMELLIEKIRDKKLLLLLDNCEHVLTTCAELTSKLVQSVPGLTILTTSRKALNIKGEKVWRISPLSLVDPSSSTDPEGASQSEAVRLFADRALSNNPGFKLTGSNSMEVALVCRKIDGIPLAVELVASRTKYMDVKTMISRLDGRLAEIQSMDPRTIERHKTLQATIGWSYKLLNEEEKTLFRRLSVFAGGFDLDAAEEVCSCEHLQKENILDTLSGLIDACLVQTVYTEDRKMRYLQLETLRQYGAKLLGERNENIETRRKQLKYYSDFAEQAYDERMSSRVYWMNIFRLEQSNFLAVLNWAEQNDPVIFSRLASNLSWFWRITGNYSMASEILERVTALEPADKETLARLNTGYGSLLFTTADFQKASVLLKVGISYWRELKNKKEEALALSTLADLTHGMGDDETGMSYSRGAFDLATELNEPHVELQCMIMVVYGLVASKRTQEARPLVKKALKMAEEFEDQYLIVFSQHMLGDCELIDGKYYEAEREYNLSLKATLKYGDKSYSCMEMTGLAMSVSGQGRLVKALRLIGAVNRIAAVSGYWIPEEVPQVFWQELIQKHIVGARKILGEELTDKTEAEGRSMSFDEAVKYALSFEID